MIENQQGLVVKTSSFSRRCYMHAPAYGAGKAGVDKMAADMAVDLKPYSVRLCPFGWDYCVLSEPCKCLNLSLKNTAP